MNTNLPYVNDYTLNRDTFNAVSSTYIPRYVERLSDEESFPDFQQRLRQTPSPTHARQFAQRILGAFAAAMAYVVRYGAAVDKLEAGRGVDNCGSTIAEYVQSLAIEVTINGRVGVAVDRVIPLTANGRPNPLKPYLVTVQAENLTSWEYAGPNSASVLETVEYNQCVGEETNRAVRWYMDEATGHAFYQVGKDAPVDSMLPAIPFVVIEGNGAIPSIAQHQRLLANLLSIAGSESPGLLQTFLVRARDAFNNGAHSRGVDDEVQVGKSRGLWYGKGEDAPAFVGQPAAPAAEARAWVQQLVNDMESLAGAGDTTLAATAAALGATIARAERQLWAAIDMFTADHTRTIRYPLSFAAQLQTERQAYIAALFENAQRASGRAGMESASVFVAEESNAGRSSAVVQAAVNAVKSAACLLNDEKSIISAFEAGAIDSESVADALGCKAGVAAKAKAERIEKAQNLAAAAAAAAAIKQGDNTVGGVGSDRTAELASKEISQSEPGTTRGENK